MKSNGSNLLYLRNLQKQGKKAICYHKWFWPFTVLTNCSCDLKTLADSWPSASNFKHFSRSLEQFFLTVGQNNFGNKIPKQHTFKPNMSTFVIAKYFYNFSWILLHFSQIRYSIDAAKGHSAFVATSTESDGVKIDRFLKSVNPR